MRAGLRADGGHACARAARETVRCRSPAARTAFTSAAVHGVGSREGLWAATAATCVARVGDAAAGSSRATAALTEPSVASLPTIAAPATPPLSAPRPARRQRVVVPRGTRPSSTERMARRLVHGARSASGW